MWTASYPDKITENSFTFWLRWHLSMKHLQTCTEHQYPPGEVAQILESAVPSLHPCCPENLPLYRDIEQYMGVIKTQVLALVPTHSTWCCLACNLSWIRDCSVKGPSHLFFTSHHPVYVNYIYLQYKFRLPNWRTYLCSWCSSSPCFVPFLNFVCYLRETLETVQFTTPIFSFFVSNLNFITMQCISSDLFWWVWSKAIHVWGPNKTIFCRSTPFIDKCIEHIYICLL